MADYGVPRASLLAATQAAVRCGVSADQALLGEGYLREDDFYRLLAQRVGLAYYRGEIAIAECLNPAEAATRGSVRLAPNPEGLSAVVAPRGRAVAALLAASAAGRSPTYYAIAAPQRLGAIVRRQMARQLAENAAGALAGVDPTLSAHSIFSNGRLACATLLALCVIFVGALWSAEFRVFCAIALWLAFGAAAALRLVAAAKPAPTEAPPPLNDFDLPLYSIIAPLYREAKIVTQLIGAIDAIDYPKSKLDIKIVVERDDLETLTALAKMRLPSRYDVIVAPPGAPATKPRALNVALPFARGDLIVIYDAEDAPAPNQLRRAAARFARDKSIDCLQARLAIFNVDDFWMAKLFAIEYAALFDVVNPGLAVLGAPIALGGTSNHFRWQTLRHTGSWDAWNVTEDADLGLRLARFARRVATIDSDTYEEAPSNLKNWFGQRRRWLKGWLQTLAVHLRNPRRLLGQLGWMRTLAALALMLGPVLGGLLGPALLGYSLWRCLNGELFMMRSILQVIGAALTLLLLVAGLGAILVPIMLALRRRRLLRLCLCLPLLPLYYCLVSVAAWAALVDLAWRPFHWWKTEHGLARTSIRESGDGKVLH
ncbi:glycosyltransferase family 2 protein [Methylocapsa sp. S129]|uniref:glycosyltransferase family 2 protein n=1 Tax=Methylocapsa sp. S129 TaxID=1641869 RepID=UPI00131B6D69|nr:glycosyltransferase [Methylocapsa sp. S129]